MTIGGLFMAASGRKAKTDGQSSPKVENYRSLVTEHAAAEAEQYRLQKLYMAALDRTYALEKLKKKAEQEVLTETLGDKR